MDKYLSFYDMYVINDEGFVSNNQFNGLFSINVNNGNIRWYGSFPKEKNNRTGLHKKIIYYNGSLVFIPECGSHIHIYRDGKFDAKCVRTEKNTENALFSGVIQRDNLLYLFPYNLKRQRALIFNMDDLSLKLLDEFNEICIGYINDSDIHILNVVDNGEKVSFAFFDTNIIAEWDISKKTVDVFGLDEDIKISSLFHSSKYGNNRKYAALTEKSNVYLIDGKNVERNYCIKSLECSMGWPINDIFDYEDMTIVLPSKSDKVVLIQEERIIELNLDMHKLSFLSGGSREWAFYKGWKYVNGNLWILPFRCDSVVVIKRNKEICYVKTDISELKEYEELSANYLKEALLDGVAMEGKDGSLKEYIETLF